MHIVQSFSSQSGKFKVKFLVGSVGAMVPSHFRQMHVECIDSIMALMHEYIVTDRGHKHSAGQSQICLWFASREAQPVACGDDPDSGKGDVVSTGFLHCDVADLAPVEDVSKVVQVESKVVEAADCSGFRRSVHGDACEDVVVDKVEVGGTRVDDVSYDVSSGRGGAVEHDGSVVLGFAGHGAPEDSDSDLDDFSCNRCGASAGDANPVHGYPCPHCHACSKRCVEGHNRIAGHACHA